MDEPRIFEMIPTSMRRGEQLALHWSDIDHDLRHSVVTLLLGMGVDPRTIHEFVGYKHIAIILRIYSHVLLSMQQGLTDKLGGLFSQ
jgi:site-specific recombinase XerD